MTLAAAPVEPRRMGLSIAEACDELDVTPTLLRREIASGRLPVRRIGRRVLISRRVLEGYLAGLDMTDEASVQAVVAAAPAPTPPVVPQPEPPPAERPMSARDVAQMLSDSVAVVMREAVEAGRKPKR